MSAPEQIVCPKCANRLNLPPQLEILHGAHKSGGGFVAFGDPDRRLPCPHCGHGLRAGDIIEGKHDMPQQGWLETLAGFALLGLIAFGLLAYCSRR
jgi:hypothetical protein